MEKNPFSTFLPIWPSPLECVSLFPTGSWFGSSICCIGKSQDSSNSASLDAFHGPKFDEFFPCDAQESGSIQFEMGILDRLSS